MRTSVRLLCSLLALASFSAAARPAGAATRTQFELAGLWSSISAGSNFVDGRPVGDIYAGAPGFAAGVNWSLTDHLSIGYRTGLFRERKDLPTRLALERWSDLPDYNPFRAASATGIERKLTSIPHHAVLAYRHHFTSRFSVFDEVGVGVTSFTEKVVYTGTREMRLAAYQKNLSVLLGLGAAWDYRNVMSIAGGVDVMLVPTEAGDVWAAGDNPQFVQFRLGILYPRR